MYIFLVRIFFQSYERVASISIFASKPAVGMSLFVICHHVRSSPQLIYTTDSAAKCFRNAYVEYNTNLSYSVHDLICHVVSQCNICGPSWAISAHRAWLAAASPSSSNCAGTPPPGNLLELFFPPAVWFGWSSIEEWLTLMNCGYSCILDSVGSCSHICFSCFRAWLTNWMW